jgi:site-specific recombinase XerD
MGNEVIGIFFPFDAGVTNIVKQVKNIKWSRTHTCWYVPCSRFHYRQIVTATHQLALIDTAELKKYLQHKQALTANPTKPLHKATVALIQQYPLNINNLKALAAYRNLLLIKNYSVKTIETYCNAFHHLLRLLGLRCVNDLNKEQLQSYLLWLTEKQNYSPTHVHLTINAIKFYFEKVLGHNSESYNLPRPKKPSKLPDVLAEEEMVTIFSAIKNIKHRALLMTSYSAGLRVNELVHLKTGDIDSKRMMIHIRSGKGNKDRFVPLSRKVLEVLREYYKVYRPKEYLFEGQNGEPYSSRSAQLVLKAAKQNAKIKKAGSIHSLRHTYATHLLENGTDIRYIQQLLGHNNIKTTMRYTHVAKHAIGNIQSPIDRLQL